MNIKQIYEGWRNKILPPEHLIEEIKKTQTHRINICNKCDFNSSNRKDYKTLRPDKHCTICGCTISAKASCLSCKCPATVPKWDAVITREEEENIQHIANENTNKENSD